MKITGPILPHNILRCMRNSDRAALGSSGYTAEERATLFNAKKEKEMHYIFEQWLNLNGLPFIHARMDKQSTIGNGAPDFTVMHAGLVLCIEFKMAGAKPSEDQARFIAKLVATRTPVYICNMAAEAIEHVRSYFHIQ